MQIADAKVVRDQPSHAVCFVRLFQNGRWKTWGGGDLPLNITSGRWLWRAQIPPTPPDLLLTDDGQTDWALEFDNVPKDFFKQLCIKALLGDGLVNNPNQFPDVIRYSFWQGCISQDAAGPPDDDS
jgi:hypothetical protein